MEITQELVKQKFIYKDGNLYWRHSTRNKKAGALAGWIGIWSGQERRRIQVLKTRLMQSQMVFLYHKGYIPEVVDHIDRNPMNDRIENLRAATNLQNARNRTSNKNSSSKYKGVCIDPKTRKWRAYIFIDKKQKGLGNFNTENEAAICYNEAAKIHHGEFANLNIII